MYFALIAYVLALAFTAICLVQASTTLGAKRIYTPTRPRSAKLRVVLPAYLEANIVEQTLTHYADLVARHIDGVVLLLSAGDRATIDAVNGWRGAHPELANAVDVKVCPTACDSKSKKLQHYWTSVQAQDEVGEWLDMVFCVFDFDARPAREFFQGIHETTMSPPSPEAPLIFQALPVSIPCSGELLPDALALAQAERTAMECWALHKWSGRRGRPMLLGLMGAAMALNGRAVSALAPWPAFSDDIQIGYRADVLGLSRTLVPVRVPVQGTSTFRDWLLQQLRIAEGVQTRVRECSRDSGHHPSSLAKALLSTIFDWSPGLRAILGATVIVCALPSYPLIAFFVVASQVGIQMLCFVRIVPVRLPGTTLRAVALAAVGAATWATLRACAGGIALLSRRSIFNGLMITALASRSDKK